MSQVFNCKYIKVTEMDGKEKRLLYDEQKEIFFEIKRMGKMKVVIEEQEEKCPNCGAEKGVIIK